MKVCGIIAEYNPFHNGHAYQINYAKKELGADYVIVVMSGDFVQRGAPAIVDKYTRAKMALLNGADLIIEMPTFYAVSSAESFAMAGVSLLESTGICDFLLFGAETPNPELFMTCARALTSESEEFKAILKDKLSQGMSYPLARKYALLATTSVNDEFLSSPNNILGIEYTKAALLTHSSMEIIPMQRTVASYHDRAIDDEITSATAIRHILTTNSVDDLEQLLSYVVPDDTASSLLTEQESNKLLIRNDFSTLLHHKLITHHSFTEYLDCSEELSNRIEANKASFVDYKSFVELLKTKNLTHTRISRVLMHITLGIKKSHASLVDEIGYSPYLRLLGFSKAGSLLLSEIKEKASTCILTKPQDAIDALEKEQYALFELDLRSADIYRSIQTSKCKIALPTEYTRKFDLANL